MSTYEYTGINSSATADFLAGAALTEPKGIALAIDDNGLKLPAAGADVVGIAILNNPDKAAVGERVDVQVKDIGLWKAGSAFSAGTLLATDASGKAVTAASGNKIVARALEAAAAADDLVRVQILNAGAAV